MYDQRVEYRAKEHRLEVSFGESLLNEGVPLNADVIASNADGPSVTGITAVRASAMVAWL